LTNLPAYNIIEVSLCTAYKTTVQTEQAMNPMGLWGWAGNSNRIVIRYLWDSNMFHRYFYTIFGT